MVSSLSYVVSPEMETESKLASSEEEYAELKGRLLEVRRKAVKRGADLHFHIVSPIQKKFSCSENIPQAVVVGSKGSLSPCVIKQLPIKGDNYYYFDNQKHLQCNLFFGNIQKESLNSIRHHNQYQQFIREFLTSNGPADCQYCLKKQIENLA